MKWQLIFSLPVFIMSGKQPWVLCLHMRGKAGAVHGATLFMNIGRQFVIVILALLLAGVGCEKKKPQLPKQAKAPVEVLPLPPEIAEAAPSEPSTSEDAEAPAEEPQPQPPKRRRPRKGPPATATQSSPVVTPPASSQPSNTIATVTPPLSPAEPHPDTAIAANVSSAQLTQQKQTTAQLIESTEKTLSGLSHGLSHDQEEMVAQVRSYVAQSKKASTEGDFERAYNLATKAHLLSDALVKQ